MAGSPSEWGSSRPSYMTALGIDSPLQQRHACKHAVNWCCIYAAYQASDKLACRSRKT